MEQRVIDIRAYKTMKGREYRLRDGKIPKVYDKPLSSEELAIKNRIRGDIHNSKRNEKLKAFRVINPVIIKGYTTRHNKSGDVYDAYIMLPGKIKKGLGCYPTAEEAHHAYLNALALKST